MILAGLGLELSEADSRTQACSAILEGIEPAGSLCPNPVLS